MWATYLESREFTENDVVRGRDALPESEHRAPGENHVAPWAPEHVGPRGSPSKAMAREPKSVGPEITCNRINWRGGRVPIAWADAFADA